MIKSEFFITHHHHVRNKICIENGKTEKQRKSRPFKFDYLRTDFFQNAKFSFLWDILFLTFFTHFLAQFDGGHFVTLFTSFFYLKNIPFWFVWPWYFGYSVWQWKKVLHDDLNGFCVQFITFFYAI